MQTMVPREEPRTPPATQRSTLLRALLGTWQRMLATLVRKVAQTLKVAVALLTGRADDAAATPTACVIVGCAALGLGVTVWTCLETASGKPWLSAGASALIGSAWVLARLFVMRIAARGTTASPSSVSRAWAAGALPWIAAGVFPLRPVTWMFGFALALRMLLHSDVERRNAWSTVGIGFGFEVVGLAVTWLARNAMVAAFLLN